ncbi:MAG: hypothetical protein HC846_03340 [Blastocatellia bacterium]|nr:hypothetical protein [Blastocatellia bacterium]
METENSENACGGRGRNCRWVGHPRPLSCEASSTNTCNVVNILEAEESDFHDSNLVAATAAIKEILANIPPDANGRNLSFLHTSMGQLLAWVEHGGDSGGSGVTADDEDERVIAALNLKL